MFHQVIQQIVDVLIIIMGSILICFTLLLIVLHFIANVKQERIQRIKQNVLRLINHNEQVYSAICVPSECVTLKEIHGIRSKRGIRVLEMVSRELDEHKAEVLKVAVSDKWYGVYLQKVIGGWNKETALLAMKLVGQLHIIGYTTTIEHNLKRWPNDTTAQEISLLTLFIQGNKEPVVKMLSNPQFKLILSFRSLRELFLHYGGDFAELYRELLLDAQDQYVRRACISGIGDNGCVEYGEVLLKELTDAPMNVLLETIRTIGKLKYVPAIATILNLTRHDAWEVRCAAVDALALLDKEHCYDEVCHCLYDEVWWVRFHAAEILAALPERDDVLEIVKDGSDRYAQEMLEYVIERNRIMEGDFAVS